MRSHSLTFSLLGILAAVVGLSVGEFVAHFIDPAFAPIEVIASTSIDVQPAAVKVWATSTFGTSSKSIVIAVVLVTVIMLAALAGVEASKRLWRGAAIMLGAGVVGVLAAVMRPTITPLAVVPSVVAAGVAAVALVVMVRLVRRSSSSVGVTEAPLNSRRAFLVGGTALLGAGAFFALARSLAVTGGTAVATAVSRLPLPRQALAPLPASVQAPVPGLAPFVTPNAAFYRIDTAFVVPRVSTSDWKLTIDGMVSRPFSITYQELLQLPMVEQDVTIMCVSNPVGGEYIGNARWLGTPLMPLLERAGINTGVDQLLSTSVDGWTCSTPTEGLAARSPLLAIGMNGEPLSAEHGFPVRMIVPGLYGFISATKWVTNITATTYQNASAYWTERGWATNAPVLTGSRIDLPRGSVSAGAQFIAGVAWAMNGNGISAVEVSVDDGPWQAANLADEPNAVTWRQWWLAWDATPGSHRIQVRATNGNGDVQTAEVADPFPSGATGLDARDVTVE